MFDTYGDGMDGSNSAYQFWTAPASPAPTLPTKSTTLSAWQSMGWTLLAQDAFRSGSSSTGSVTVPAGNVMFMAYDCNANSNFQTTSGCGYTEQSIQITSGVVGPTLAPLATGPAAACSPNCVPTGSETPSATLTLPAGKEAYMEWTTSTGPGGDENLIYYRTSGTTGWTTAWDLCTGTTCTSGTTYESFSYVLPDGSSASILFQTPGVYELLVWDVNGDGTGAGSYDEDDDNDGDGDEDSDSCDDDGSPIMTISAWRDIHGKPGDTYPRNL